MNNITRLKKNIFYPYIITMVVTIIWAIIVNCDFLYLLLLLIWISMMFYTINKFYQRVILFCFGIAFFTFLMGRDGMEYFFNHEKETTFTIEVNYHAYLCMIISLVGVWLTFAWNGKKPSSSHLKISKKKSIFYDNVRRYSKIAFYIVYPFAIGINIAIAYFVFKFGYAAKFTDLREQIDNSPIFYIFTKIELLLPAALGIYMATLPSKEQFMKIMKPYIIYLLITLGTGGRGIFLLGLLLTIIFMAFMQHIQPNIVWINRRNLNYIIICIPLFMIGSTFINAIRFDNADESMTIIDGISDFFYDQGVSGNTLKRAYEYEDDIPKQADFYTLEFLHAGIPARILGYPVYQGNTIEHATKGGSFTHALGYTIMGNVYLTGRGPGSSYIAELFYDFGYVGVFLGSCIYGYIFSIILNLKKTGIVSRAIIFSILTKLLWAPRGGYSSFISFIFAPTTILLLVFVFSCAQISYVKYLKTHKSIN